MVRLSKAALEHIDRMDIKDLGEFLEPTRTRLSRNRIKRFMDDMKAPAGTKPYNILKQPQITSNSLTTASTQTTELTAEDADAGARPSTKRTQELPRNPTTIERPCLACGDLKRPSRLVQFPCVHEYCHACLISFVETSLSDDSLFPPRCCGMEIPITAGRGKAIGEDLMQRFETKLVEMRTINRTYCYEPGCGAFLHPDLIPQGGGLVICPECRALTCSRCKRVGHIGEC
ncbi:hypothetical protein BJX64DRAFT_294461 [Aspergillus heterothallicus]